MIRYCKILLLSILFISVSKSHGMQDWMAGITLSIPTKYDFRNKDLAAGLSANMHFLFFNMSLEHPSVIKGSDNTIKYHIGLGVITIGQIQYGFDYKLRLRSDFVLFGNNSPLFSSIDTGWWIFRKGVVISPILDIPLKKEKSLTFGVGLGLQI